MNKSLKNNLMDDLLEEGKKEFGLKLKRIKEEQDLMEEERRGRGMQKKVEYDSESGLLVSTNPEEEEKAEDAKEYCPYCGKRLSAKKIREMDKQGRWYCNGCDTYFYRVCASRCPYCDSKDIHLAIRS